MIAAFKRALGNDAYSQYLLRNPSAAQQAALIASAPLGLSRNETSSPYDPANVVGIVLNNYTNLAREQARGVDLSASYTFDLFGGKADANGAANWLTSDRQARPGGNPIQRAGLVFNPPKFRGRAAAAWSKNGLTLAGSVNLVGGITDDQQAITLHQSAFTTVDATIRYRTGHGNSVLSDLELLVSLSNIFNQKPLLRTPAADFVVNFDSTNYSAAGRVIGASLIKHW